MRGWKACDHKNLILARKSEEWILDRIRDFVESPESMERVLQRAMNNRAGELRPQKEALGLTQAALRENQAQTEQMFAMMNGGQANSSLFAMLNERATQLQSKKERLQREERVLLEALAPLSSKPDASAWHGSLAAVGILLIPLAQASPFAMPAKCPLHHPMPGQDFKTFPRVGLLLYDWKIQSSRLDIIKSIQREILQLMEKPLQWISLCVLSKLFMDKRSVMI